MTHTYRNTTLCFYGYKFRTADLRACLLKLTDLTNALYSFSIRVLIHERPRRTMVIDLEMARGYDPERYAADTALYELLAQLKKMHRAMHGFVQQVPAAYFPELHLHAFGCVQFNTALYRTRVKCRL